VRRDTGASTRRTLDPERPADGPDAVGQALQAGAAQGIGAPRSVIGHPHDEIRAVEIEADPGGRSPGVPGHVGEGLGDDEVGGRLDGRRKAIGDPNIGADGNGGSKGE
jgi:hypothetical protein